MKHLAWLLAVVFAASVQMVANEVADHQPAPHQRFIGSNGTSEMGVIFDRSFLSAGQGLAISKPPVSAALVPAAVDPRLNGRPTVKLGSRGAASSYLGSECLVTPEPGSIILTASGLAGLIAAARRRRKQA